MLLAFRPVSIDDADLLLYWRNDPLTRKMSVTQHEITRKEHIAWLTKRLESWEAIPLIAETIEGVPVGTIRKDGDELSWTVAPEHRGQGLGSNMVALAVERFGEGLRAKIKPENIASLKIAERCGLEIELV